MKTMSTFKNTLSRTFMTLFIILAMTLTASATDYITDVMLLGNKNQTTFNSQLSDLTDQGWLDIDDDLNAGCGSGSDYIHLLYKKQSSSGNTGVPITDFYIRTGDNPPSSLIYDGRTYYLVPCQGSDSFINSQGDLNNNAAGDYIYLYYTKDALTINHGVTEIYFNYLQYGAVSANGGSTGYNLNAGCGSSSDLIYMHIATTAGANVVTLSSGSGNVQLQDGHILTGTGGADTKVTITDGATVTLSGVNITAIANDNNHEWPGISCLGNAVIVLEEGTTNTVNGGSRSSGIYVPVNKTLTIQGSGTLNANGSWYAAGIGGAIHSNSSCGNITINGGTINATSAFCAPGIGSSSGTSNNHSSCGDVTINGGTVNATGGEGGAGIGSGFTNSSCDNISIKGGTVNATGGKKAAGIGSGHYQSDCGSIIISGGTVTATGGEKAAGIGSGYNQSDCWRISITHGVTSVTATKGTECDNAIGAGNNSTCGDVNIGYVETGFITQSPFTTFPYYVALNSNGGTGFWGNMQPFMYNVAQPLWENVSTCTGYTWDGWATTPEGPKMYDDEDSVINLTDTPSGTVTLYARWKALKDIAGYSTSGGWQLIASPLANDVTPNEENGFITGSYDLYRFNQAADAEWENWKDAANYHFNLESGRGYLYANQTGTTLTFNGTPYSGNGQVTLTKTANAEFEGCNLIGNPFGTTATINKAFYRMNPETHAEIILADNNTIAPMEGVFVVAAENNEIATFTQQSSKADNDEEMVVINLGKDNTTIDRAIVRFDEGQTLPKFQLFENNTKIYIPQNGTDYAMVTAKQEGELPINFKAKENGVYTLTVSETFRFPLSVLRLIDHLTGADIDLLTTPNYTFEAKTTDHANRFKLVFMENEDNQNNNDIFAYISNGELIVNGEGTLQVLDALGRQLFSKNLSTSNSSLLTPNFPSGVYVLRLVNGDTIRTQKVVFE